MIDYFNAEMMIVARQVRRFSQTQLAKELRMTQSSISKIEAGYIVPDAAFAEKLAVALSFESSFFFRQGRLRPAPANFHRKRQKLGVNDWEQILARSEIYRICIEEMLRSVDLVPSRAAPPCIDPDQFDGRVDLVANAVRQAWMLPRGPIQDVTALIEDAGIIIVPFDFGTDLIDAFCQLAGDTLPPLIFQNTRFKNKDRIRYSLSHELAHIVMHRIPKPEMEMEANRFAAAFLMPEADIRHALYGMSLEKLMTLKLHWKTSMQAILMRARDLNRVTERGYRYYQMTMSKRGWRSAEPVEVQGAIEAPRLLQKLINSHVKELGYSFNELAGLFGINSDDLSEIYTEARPKLRVVTSN
jgi:Zn-dependent peptidase ImmA (M78 family)/transcriptional regulator with XRE-family HTH domain